MSLAAESQRVRTGQVVAAHGRRLLVEDTANARNQPCVPRGKRLRAVCGDRVRWLPPRDSGDGLIVEIDPRTTALERPDSRGRNEVCAANVTQLVIVGAPRPAADPSLVDRYLVAAELMPCRALLVYNKADLAANGAADPWLQEIAAIGYTILRTSVRTGAGLPALARALTGHTSIFVGQSGVGKSSLLNALVPGLDTRTAALSAGTGLGRHTTSAAVLHRLPVAGAIIDSPGVRDYGPPRMRPRDIVRGFVEFLEPALACRFADCLHRDEPNCAVKRAVAQGRVSARRYESYLKLVERMESLAPAW